MFLINKKEKLKLSLKNHRVEIRISEEEKKLIEKIKLENKKNTADLFREFLNSYDIENHNKNLKILLEELEEEKEKIYSELHLVYHNLRSHYLPYRLAFDLLRGNEDYFLRNKDSIRAEDYKKFLEFQDFVANEKRLKKLDEIRVQRDSLKTRLKTIENRIYKLNGY